MNIAIGRHHISFQELYFFFLSFFCSSFAISWHMSATTKSMFSFCSQKWIIANADALNSLFVVVYFKYFDSCGVSMIIIIICCCGWWRRKTKFDILSSWLLRRRCELTALNGMKKNLEKRIKKKNVLFWLYFLIFLRWMKCSLFHVLYLFVLLGVIRIKRVCTENVPPFIYSSIYFCAATNGNSQFISFYPDGAW